MPLDSTSAHEQLSSAASDDRQRVDVDLAAVPTLAEVRVGGHATFDRVVFELEGDRPGHDVRYVDEHDWRMDLDILLKTLKGVIRREGISADGVVTMREFMGGSGGVDDPNMSETVAEQHGLERHNA